MKLITTTKFAIGELAHKARIVADEPDLQESYSITEAQAESACLELMRQERAGAVLDTGYFSIPVLEMLEGEARDAAVVQRDIAKDARSNLSKQYGAIQKGARELEAIADALEQAAVARKLAEQSPEAA